MRAVTAFQLFDLYDFFQAPLGMGGSAAEMGKFHCEMMGASERALERKREDGWALNLLGLLYEQEGLFGQAERAFSR